jgi:hypothetical protein
MKRRLLRILGIGLAVLVFTGYFAFSTFLFSPFEGDYEFELATLVPRDVELFAAKQGLAEDFAGFPELRFEQRLARTERGERLLASPEWSELEAALGLEQARSEVAALLASLPIPVDPLQVAGGRELAFASYASAPTLQASDWALYLRTNWIGKLGVELLAYPDLLGLDSQGLTVERFDTSVRIWGGQLPRPVFVSRLRDVIVVSSVERLVVAAHDLRERQGEDSLGQSATYYDNVARVAREGDELRLAIDYKEAAARLGWPLELSKRPDPPALEGFLSALFRPAMVRELTGVLGFKGGLWAEFVGELDPDELTPLQKRLYRDRDADQRRMAEQVARFAPADSGLFAYLEADLKDLLEAFFLAAEPALRSNFESEIVRPVFGQSTLDGFLTQLSTTFADRLAVIARPNDFPTAEGDPPNDGLPTYAWAIVLWTEDRDGVTGLRDRINSNQASLGIRGAKPGDRGVFTLEIQGGNVVYEYWAPLVPGTGHIASLQDQDFLIVSNHSRMLERVIAAYYDDESATSLARRSEFIALTASGLPSATLSVWLDPSGLVDTWVELAADEARFAALNGIDWETTRVQIEQRVLRESFPGEVWGSVSLSVKDAYERMVEEQVERFRTERQAQIVPELVGRAERRADALELVSCGLVQLRLEPKVLQFAARLLAPLED